MTTSDYLARLVNSDLEFRRPLAALLCSMLLGAAVSWIAAMAARQLVGGSSIEIRLLISGVLTPIVAIAVLLCAAASTKVSVTRLVWRARRPRLRWFFVGALLPLAALIVVATPASLQSDFDLLAGRELKLLSLTMAAIAAAAFAEELVFRGWAFQAVAGRTSSILIAVCASSVLFWMAHAFGQKPSLAPLYLGVVLSLMTAKTAGIEFSTGYHMSHNAVVVLVAPLLPQLAAEQPVTALGLFAVLALMPAATLAMLYRRKPATSVAKH